MKINLKKGLNRPVMMRHNISSGSGNEYAHDPVMCEQVLYYMEGSLDAGNLVVDCTLGEGGHSELILKTFKNIELVAFERDAVVMEIAKKRLGDYKERITIINDNFSNIANHLQNIDKPLCCILYDLGISSFHFEKSGRGFSFQGEEPLDMRLDENADVTASTIIMKSTEKELTDIFSGYGEERWAKKIARFICSEREKEVIQTTGQLAALVLRAIPRRYHVRNIHPATRVFQALRIAVNNELEAVKRSLSDAVELVSPGGRIIVISFHSLEDRIVKTTFREHSVRERDGFPDTGPVRASLKVLTKKPLLPDEQEINRNKRSRSAKMRVGEKIVSDQYRTGRYQ